jgi:excinuclease UvrABC nuclease subunit
MAKKGFSKKNIENVQGGPGVYKLFNPRGNLTYVGKAKDLPGRLLQHKDEGDVPNVSQFEVNHTKTIKEAQRIEKNIIQRSKPIHNIKKE